MYRVYIADFNPPVWEIDTGPETASRRFDNVIASAVGFFKSDPGADNINNPKAWVEYPDAKLKIINTTAILR